VWGSPIVTDPVLQQCVHPECGRRYGLTEVVFRCRACGGLLDVRYDWEKLKAPSSLSFFERRWRRGSSSREQALDVSGVWRFRELLPFARPEHVITLGEGQTLLQRADGLAPHLGLSAGRLMLQYEGLNPSGSFKDNGMTAAFTVARMLGRRRVACASTGNTGASMAMYAAAAGGGPPMQAIVLIGSGKIACGKLAQTLDYGALTLQIEGDFDACLRRVVEAADRLNLYLMNSMNPFRLEGQKAIMYRVLEGCAWEPPDWIVVPGGNLGNCSAFGKAFEELHTLGLVARVPRLAVINAAGANALYKLYHNRGIRWNGGHWRRDAVDAYYAECDATGRRARTLASAIEIGRPVNLSKALRALELMNGVVRQVSDEEILDHRALVGRFGFGCEPASAAAVAGLHQLVREQIIGRDERVVCVLTGHQLKDAETIVGYHAGVGARESAGTGATPRAAGPWSNAPRSVPDRLEDIIEVLESAGPENPA